MPVDGCSQRDLETVAAEVSEEVESELEYECAFDWVMFCPTLNPKSGALTRYFGKRRGVSVLAPRPRSAASGVEDL